ncbi:MAG TPA: cytochrome c oxidase subunit 3, partial [Rhodobacteraceae bacterium]|nr:cytochrome c oxidase subunit 3 [Paracoccaceae bacterium]
MAHEKNHDYHILNPSIWPFLGALSGFTMLFGMVLWVSPAVENNHPWVFFIGLAGVLYVMYAWWSDVIREGKEGDHTPVVIIGLRYGML